MVEESGRVDKCVKCKNLKDYTMECSKTAKGVKSKAYLISRKN
jgi:hypothetical protein